MWWLKLFFAVLIDIFDFTIGRLLFVAPFAGEVAGVILCLPLFGWKALFYAWEMIDVTEQFDGFVPTATLIALAARKDYEE